MNVRTDHRTTEAEATRGGTGAGDMPLDADDCDLMIARFHDWLERLHRDAVDVREEFDLLYARRERRRER